MTAIYLFHLFCPTPRQLLCPVPAALSRRFRKEQQQRRRGRFEASSSARGCGGHGFVPLVQTQGKSSRFNYSVYPIFSNKEKAPKKFRSEGKRSGQKIGPNRHTRPYSPNHSNMVMATQPTKMKGADAIALRMFASISAISRSVSSESLFPMKPGSPGLRMIS